MKIGPDGYMYLLPYPIPEQGGRYHIHASSIRKITGKKKDNFFIIYLYGDNNPYLISTKYFTMQKFIKVLRRWRNK